MANALFDPITNSEDEMISRAGIKKHHACTYLRAYIMASLCFEPQLVVSDSTVNLNRAFRTLITNNEGDGNYNLDYVPDPDFDWLIKEGHIRFAARDTFEGNFSEALRESQMGKRNVTPPSVAYTRMIDEICSNEYVYWYSLDEVSKRFTSKFMGSIKKDLNNDNIPLEWVGLFRELISRLSDKETIKYSDVKSILLDTHHSEKSPEYQYIRKILRQSYDYNVPDLLGLDYCMPLQGIKPSREQDWMLKSSIDLSLPYDLLCNVYGLSELPAKNLKYIWESSEYENFSRQISKFRAGTIELNEYVISVESYVRKINEVAGDAYKQKHNKNRQYEKGKFSSVPIMIRQYMADDTSIVIAKSLHNMWDIAGLFGNFIPSIFEKVLFKVIPVLANRGRSVPNPPEKINEAIILQK